MNREYYTFLIFPGPHGKLRKIHLPRYLIHLTLGFAIAGVVTAGALASSYARMLLKVSTYNTLRSERAALQTRCSNLEGAVTEANGELASLQALAAEVALAFRFSEGPSPRFPGDVLLAATRRHATLGGAYNASLYAFNMMKATPVLASYTSTTSPWAFEKAYQDSATPSLWPVRGPITAGFGERMDPFTGEGEFHTGVDIAAPIGTPIRAAADGILFVAGPEPGFGNEALIDHGYGTTTKYAHLSRLYVVVGQEVRRGQIIGAVGVTGRTTGPHLHYEVLVQGTPVNPARYLPRYLPG